MRENALALVLTVVFACPIWAQQASTFDNRPKITVSGVAVVKVEPNRIVINFGIETRDVEVTIAQKKNRGIQKKALDAFRIIGVPKEAIQTDYLSIEPKHKSYSYSQIDSASYVVRSDIVVTLTEAAKVEDLVSVALKAGVNYVHGIEFQTTEFKKYREQSRELALKAAKEKAESMAAVLGESIGSPIQITENYTGSPWWYSSSWRYGRSVGMSQNVIVNIPSESGDTSEAIALGKISIQASVSVIFALKE